MKISVRNFQAIDSLSLDVTEGLTVIVGPSNNGKSSIFRSLDTLLYPDTLHSHFIKSGSSESVVSLEHDGNALSLSRGTSSPKKAFFNSEAITIPEEKKLIRDHFNLKTISIGSQTLDLNFWRQMDKPFLLDFGPPTLFDFFSQASKQEKIQNASKKVAKDLKELGLLVTKEEGVNEFHKKEITSIVKEKRAYFQFKEAYDLIQSGNSLKKRLVEGNQIISSIRDTMEEYAVIKGDYVEKKRFLEAVSPLLQKRTMLESLIEEVNNLLRVISSEGEKIKTTSRSLESREEFIRWYKGTEVSEVEGKLKLLHDEVSVFKEFLLFLGRHEEEKKDIIEKIEYKKSVINKLNSMLEDFDMCPLCGKPMEEGVQCG